MWKYDTNKQSLKRKGQGGQAMPNNLGEIWLCKHSQGLVCGISPC